MWELDVSNVGVVKVSGLFSFMQPPTHSWISYCSLMSKIKFVIELWFFGLYTNKSWYIIC